MATSNLLETGLLKDLMKASTIEASLAVEEDIKYLYDTLAPTIAVQKSAGEAWTFVADASLNQVNDLITPRSVPNEIGGSYTKTSYTTDKYALRMMITQDDIETYGSVTVLTQQATQNVISALRGNMELRFHEKFLNENAGWKVTFSGQDTTSDINSGKICFWNDEAATILDNIDAMKEKAGAHAGNYKLNRILMSKDVWDAIKRNSEVYTQMQADASAPKNNAALLNAFATLTEVDRVDVVDYWTGVRIDKVRKIDEIPSATKEELEDVTYTRSLKGVFMLYRHEEARTLANKAAWNVIDVPSNRVSFNRGIPTMRIYDYHDKGSESFWVEGRIGAGLHLSNPKGAVFAKDVIKTV